jgi:DNA-binding NarL/FixJ family response regulator
MRVIEEHPDLGRILLNLNLPDRDGFSVLSELRMRHPAISVVVMSAQEDHDSVVKALNQGARGFIPKSATREVILGAMQLVISGGVYMPPQPGASTIAAVSSYIGPRTVATVSEILLKHARSVIGNRNCA